MMRFLRSQSQIVLIVILGVIGLSFLFYGSVGNLLTSPGGRTTSDYGSIDGESLSANELFDAIRNTRYALILSGRGQDLSQPGMREQIAEEAWRQLLLLHEADRLHIDVSNPELVSYIQGSPIFQKDHVFNPDFYQSQMAVLQGVLRIPADPGPDPLVSTKAAVETVMRNNLRADAASKALFSSVRASAHDVADAYEKYYGSVDLSVITFDPKAYAATVSVTPDEIAAEYKAHPENPAYRTTEKRKVDYVIFPLTPDQAKLPDKDKSAALEALGEKALNFAVAFQPDPSANPGAFTPPDFIAEAKKAGLNVNTTDFFTADTPPAGLPPSPSFNNAAFALSKDDPVSKVIELSDGVAVLHLAEIQPSDLRPLAEVQSQIQQQLQQTKAAQAAEAAAQNAEQSLQALVAKGTDFNAAAIVLGLRPEPLPSFIPAKVSQGDQRLQTIAYVTTSLSVGQVSRPIPVESDKTTVIFHVNARGPADPSGLAAFESRFRQSQDQQLRSLVYLDWANAQNRRPGTHKPPGLDSYGSID